MFTTGTPEQCGIRSAAVQRFIRFLEESGVALHSALFLRGNTIFSETYWAPFHRDTCHRMYSQTKSYVSIAIGLLEEEGKLSLDDRIADFFPERIDTNLPAFMKNQTVRDMLTMTTCAHAPYWFYTTDPDRTHEYLNQSDVIRPSGGIWEYDSQGSQVLSTLAEKLAGMPLFDYLNEKIFRHLDAFKTASILKTRNDDSWGDSALLCTSRDMLTFARFLMNGGSWNGKRLMNEAYIKAATSALADNHKIGFSAYNECGYGYQIWHNRMGGFSFHGMGGQYTITVPNKDFIFVCTGDNQGFEAASDLIFNGLREFIVADMGAPLPESKTEQTNLQYYSDTRTLAVCAGEPDGPDAEWLDGAVFVCEKNKTGIERFSFTFEDNAVTWHYTNAQGAKSIRCGLGNNVLTKFPQTGYSTDYGGAPSTDGYLYDCAASAGWLQPNRLGLRIQIIDRYIGNLFAQFAFTGDMCAVKMVKHAEAFLDEYEGEFLARRQM